jgi:hypothetical protein
MEQQHEHSTFHDGLMGKHVTVKNWDGRDIRGIVTDTMRAGAITMVAIQPESEWNKDIIGHWVNVCICEVIDCDHPEKYVHEDYRADCISDPPAQIGWEEFLRCGICGKEIPFPQQAESGVDVDPITF